MHRRTDTQSPRTLTHLYTKEKKSKTHTGFHWQQRLISNQLTNCAVYFLSFRFVCFFFGVCVCVSVCARVYPPIQYKNPNKIQLIYFNELQITFNKIYTIEYIFNLIVCASWNIFIHSFIHSIAYLSMH